MVGVVLCTGRGAREVVAPGTGAPQHVLLPCSSVRSLRGQVAELRGDDELMANELMVHWPAAAAACRPARVCAMVTHRRSWGRSNRGPAMCERC